MATITLYESKINNMPGFINEVKSSVREFNSELFNVKNKSLTVNPSICNLDDIINSISVSTKLQDEKIKALDRFQKDIEDFSTNVEKIDSNVACVITEQKNEFYDKYTYLKPDCEKNGWEKFCAGYLKASQWCKENWALICNIALSIVAVVAIVALCIATFGTAAVVLAAIVGGLFGIASQFISDAITFAATGKWEGTIQSYVGAALGGIAGGVMTLTGNYVGACALDSAISTLFSESMDSITGKDKKSEFEIWTDVTINAGISVTFSKMFGGISSKLSKNLSKKIPALKRLSGRGSYDASFKMVITKLKNGTIKKFSIKSVRNGVIGGLSGDIVSNIANGFGLGDFFKDNIKAIFPKRTDIYTNQFRDFSRTDIITQINLLPNRIYQWSLR